MAKGSENLQPLDFYHRFFNFVVNNLIGQGKKRVSLGRAGAVSHESVPVPIEGPSRNVKIKNSTVKRRSKSNGEVAVEFRHIEEVENGSPAHFPKQNGLAHGSSDTVPMPQRSLTRTLPIRAQASNINERTAAFIRSRKEAMMQALHRLEPNNS